MTKDEALRMALEALECLKRDFDADQFEWGIADEAITALREALAQPERLAELGWQEIDCPICGGGARAFPKPEQEPMAWIERDMQCDDFDPDSVTCEKPTIAADGWEWVALYTTPPQRKPDNEAYTALEQALTRLQKRYGELEAKVAAQQQPVGKWTGIEIEWIDNPYKFKQGQPIYTTSPHRKPLTDDEIIGWVESGEYNVITNDWASHIEFARAIEAKLRSKNEHL